MPAPKHSPFAVEDPTLSPVYEPGPMLTHTASQSCTRSPQRSRTSCTYGAVIEACMRGASLCAIASVLPSRSTAAEQRAVDVSIRMIVAMSLLEK